MSNQLTIKGAGLSQAAILALIAANAAPLSHKTQHQDGGSDELDLTGMNNQTGEGHIVIAVHHPASIGQGSWLSVLSGGYYNNSVLYNTTAASGDNCSYKVFLDKGTYTLNFISNYDNNLSITKLYLDSTQIATFDHYAAGANYNQFFQQTGIIVTTPGIYTLKILTNSKNAASGGYGVRITGLSLFRTA